MPEPYCYEPHHWHTLKEIPWMVFCKHCGLLKLNNDFTRWAIRMGCNNRDHPAYATTRMRCTGKDEL